MTQQINDTHAEGHSPVEKLRELIKDIRIAMLTTVDEDGSLHSRPMATQQVEFDGDLWFFTNEPSGKTSEVRHDRHVNATYSDHDKHRYVSVSGPCEIVRDKAKINELWNPVFRAWFPKGLEDPTLALMRVRVEKAEYWDSPSSPVAHLIGFAKAVLKGKPMKVGEHDKLNLGSSSLQH